MAAQGSAGPLEADRLHGDTCVIQQHHQLIGDHLRLGNAGFTATRGEAPAHAALVLSITARPGCSGSGRSMAALAPPDLG